MSNPRLSADDIAAHLGVTKDTVYAWIAERACPPTRLVGCGSSGPAKSTSGFEVVVPLRRAMMQPQAQCDQPKLSVAADSVDDFI